MTIALDHAAEAVGALQALWKRPGAGPRGYGLAPYRPIAGSEFDQPVPNGTENPLWDIVRWMPASPPLFGPGPLEPEGYTIGLGVDTLGPMDALGVGRRQLCQRYAWSIITPGDVAWIVEQLGGRGVVEIGAGSGYWAWQLEQAGIDVAAYDPHPVADDNEYCKRGPYTTVLTAGPEAAAEHPDRALLMVWPPYEGKCAEEALRAYSGDLLIYAGEQWGGCTADDGFYELLDAEWDEVAEAPKHVTWSGIHCSLKAYRRKAR